MTIERVARFGPERRIVGVTCEPLTAVTADPAFIFMNAGVLHRVGPNRMNVEFARALARAGIRSLRFDLSGLGDSAPRLQTDNADDANIADARDAFEFLHKKWSVNRFVLLGLCSGAFLSHRLGVSDDRVVGAVFLDGYGYATVGHKLHAPIDIATNPRRLGNIAKRVVRGLTDRQSAAPRVKELDEDLPVFEEPFPPLEQTRREIETMLRAGKRLLFIYSGGVTEYFNHREQFSEMYGDLNSKGDVDLEYYERDDHLYTWSPHRRRMIERTVSWALERFGSRPVAQPDPLTAGRS